VRGETQKKKKKTGKPVENTTGKEKNPKGEHNNNLLKSRRQGDKEGKGPKKRIEKSKGTTNNENPAYRNKKKRKKRIISKGRGPTITCRVREGSMERGHIKKKNKKNRVGLAGKRK